MRRVNIVQPPQFEINVIDLLSYLDFGQRLRQAAAAPVMRVIELVTAPALRATRTKLIMRTIAACPAPAAPCADQL
jgi:hypothetical protein